MLILCIWKELIISRQLKLWCFVKSFWTQVLYFQTLWIVFSRIVSLILTELSELEIGWIVYDRIVWTRRLQRVPF